MIDVYDVFTVTVLSLYLCILSIVNHCVLSVLF